MQFTVQAKASFFQLNAAKMSDKYLLEAEIITPVHIGAGQERKLIRNLDFIFMDKKLIIFDTAKIFKALNETDRARFINNLAGGSLKDITLYMRSAGTTSIDDYKIAEINCPGSHPMDEVLPLISAAGKSGRAVYIPGSSIKGALRSVLFAYLYGKGKGVSDNEIFGRIDKNLMSFIQVGDAHFKTSRIINAKIYNLHRESGEWTSGWKHDFRSTDRDFSTSGFVTSYEVFGIKSKAAFTLKINKEKIAYIRSKEGELPQNCNILETMNINDLFGIINWHTERYLKAERDFFRLYDNQEPYCEAIITKIDELLNLIPHNNNKCLMHIGCGSGFHAITGDWQFAGKHSETGIHENGKIRFKSRKMAFRKLMGHSGFEFLPMGFIMLHSVK